MIYKAIGHFSSILVLPFILFFFISIPSPVFAEETGTLEQRYESLIHELRCVVCQNQSIAESSATIAKDMRDWVYKALNDGKTDSQIKSELISHYGDFVLYQPPLKANTWLLWFGPLGIFGLMFVLARRRSVYSRETLGNGQENRPKMGRVVLRSYMLPLIGAGLVVLIIAGYSIWGGGAKIQEFKALQRFDQELQELVQEIPKLEQSVVLSRLQHLSDRSEVNPIVLERLGALYAALQWWKEAAEVYWRAYQETGGVEVGGGYLNAVFMAQNGKLSDKDKAVMEDILAKNPDNTAALNLKALEAFSEKRYSEAKSIWIQIRTQLEPGTSLYDTITEAINKVGE